jgi:putative ABC transport system ATP-binding protein
MRGNKLTSLPNQTLALEDVSLALTGGAGRVEILKSVSAEIEAGEIVALTGPSGSGKSSLLAVAAGLERATSGSIRLLGNELVGRSEDDLARIRRSAVGVVFQSFHLLPNMTALENVALAAEIAGAALPQEAARAALARVGLSPRAAHYPSQLSGGEQQRTAVARAAVTRPKILFADEPTGNLDSASGAVVRDLLFGLAREDKASLVLVTHEPDLAALCDRVIRMADGRIVA